MLVTVPCWMLLGASSMPIRLPLVSKYQAQVTLVSVLARSRNRVIWSL